MMTPLRTILLCLLLAGPAVADDGAESIELTLRDDNATEVLQAALSDPSFWEGADTRTYDGELYSEIRLQEVDSGYIPMIRGEGGEDFTRDVVDHVVFRRQDDLLPYMETPKTITYLGEGHDPTIGTDYTDALFFLDFKLFYIRFIQRMYHKLDGDRMILWFEKMDASFTDAETWAAYEQKIETILEGIDTRWAFSAVHEPEEYYGMFLLEAGETYESRITYVSKLGFGKDAGWVARMGSNMPSVLRSGLQSAFVASVKVCRDEQAKRGE